MKKANLMGIGIIVIGIWLLVYYGVLETASLDENRYTSVSFGGYDFQCYAISPSWGDYDFTDNLIQGCNFPSGYSKRSCFTGMVRVAGDLRLSAETNDIGYGTNVAVVCETSDIDFDNVEKIDINMVSQAAASGCFETGGHSTASVNSFRNSISFKTNDCRGIPAPSFLTSVTMKRLDESRFTIYDSTGRQMVDTPNKLKFEVSASSGGHGLTGNIESFLAVNSIIVTNRNVDLPAQIPNDDVNGDGQIDIGDTVERNVTGFFDIIIEWFKKLLNFLGGN